MSDGELGHDEMRVLDAMYKRHQRGAPHNKVPISFSNEEAADLTPILRKLEEKGHVERAETPDGQPVPTSWKLTQRGRDLAVCSSACRA